MSMSIIANACAGEGIHIPILGVVSGLEGGSVHLDNYRNSSQLLFILYFAWPSSANENLPLFNL